MNKALQIVKETLESSIKLTDERITSLEDTTKNIPNYVEFDCPICKHETLAKKTYGLKRDTNNLFGLPLVSKEEHLYCYSCGKTFQMEEKKVWKEVK